MSDPVLWLRLAHILGAILLFGTGLGTAFFMWRAARTGDVTAIAVTARAVVLADWLFTTPAVIAQPLTGAGLAYLLGYGMTEGWILASLGLYLLAGACWLPVVGLQLRMRREAEAARDAGQPLPAVWHRDMRIWFILGWPAFLAVIAILVLMVFRPG